MASIFDRIREMALQGASNLGAWKQVATSPSLRQEYMGSVVKPKIEQIKASPYGKLATFSQKKIQSTAGPLFTALSPIETGIDIGLRKEPGLSFGQKIKAGIQRGGDIPGALQSRGMPGRYAFPLGMAAAIAIPGAGELSGLRKTGQLLDTKKGINFLEPKIQDPIQRFLTTLKAAKPIRTAQELLKTQEKAKRFARLASVGQEAVGEKGFYAKLSQLKGELPRVQFESLRGKIGQQDIDNFFNKINTSSLSEWEKLPAGKGLAKIFGEYGGQVPTEGELKLLNKVFGPEFAKTVLEKRSIFKKISDAGYQLFNIPRSLMTSLDMSAPFRQGAFLIGRPKQFFSSFAEMFRVFPSEKAFQELQSEIASRPTYKLMRENKLFLADIDSLLTGREERFMSSWAEKIPLGVGKIVRASGRAYTGFLNKLRADVFDDMLSKAKNVGVDAYNDTGFMSSVADFVNTATGRGSLGSLEMAAKPLNTFLFSPRLLASRLQLLNPQFYAKQDPFVRKEALKSLFSFASLGLTALGLAKMGGAKVEADPRNADFGKIKIGNTRVDIWGGFQQPIRLAAQLISGKIVSSTTGQIMTLGEGYKPLTRLDILTRFVEYKESPLISFISDLMRGKTVMGEDIELPKEVLRRLVPMVAQDIKDLYDEWGPKALPAAILPWFGVGLQTYGPKEGTAFFYYDKWSKMPPKEANVEARELKKSDPQLYASVKKLVIYERLGITKEEQAMVNLGVKDGSRAKAVFKELEKLKTGKEKNERVKLLREAKIITDDVYKQLKELVKKPKQQSFKIPSLVKTAHAMTPEETRMFQGTDENPRVHYTTPEGWKVNSAPVPSWYKGPLPEGWEKGLIETTSKFTETVPGIKTQGTQSKGQVLAAENTVNTDKIIDENWGDQSENAKLILSKENAARGTGKEMDIPNRIDPETGEWDDNAPILIVKDPFTNEDMQSIDRGLFRINNRTFLTWLRGKKERQWMYEAGIIDKEYLKWEGLDQEERDKIWDRMLDPTYNTKFAKLLYDKWGPNQWAVVKKGLVKLDRGDII